MTDLKKIIENMPAGIILTDENFVLQYINGFAKKLFESLGFNLKLGEDTISSLPFYTFNKEQLDFRSCVKAVNNANSNNFLKSLLVKNENGEDKFLLLAGKRLPQSMTYTYSFVINDFSSETDCLASFQNTGEEDAHRNAIIGRHTKIMELQRLINLAADTNVSVLITGESGTGKELIADAVHYRSERRSKPFIKVNCSALTETLLESELFGHVKGAFTGAYKDKTGKFEQAHGGTIFLDEIGEISQALQVKLLRVLQNKTIERVGDNKPVKVDMRIIAATNKNLRDLITQGQFREDFFYRLNVFPIYTPPLRERKNDIPLLCNYFIKKFNRSFGKNIKALSTDAYRLLMDYCWPGNVRELENVIEHAFVLAQSSMIEIFDLPQELRMLAYKEGFCRGHEQNTPQSTQSPSGIKKTNSGRLKISKEDLLLVLEENEWNQTQTAQKLGISRVALWKKIKKFNLNDSLS